MNSPHKASLTYQFIWAWPHGACEVVTGLPDSLQEAVLRTGLFETLPPDEPGAYILELTIRPDPEAYERAPEEQAQSDAYIKELTRKLQLENDARERRLNIKLGFNKA